MNCALRHTPPSTPLEPRDALSWGAWSRLRSRARAALHALAPSTPSAHLKVDEPEERQACQHAQQVFQRLNIHGAALALVRFGQAEAQHLKLALRT